MGRIYVEEETVLALVVHGAVLVEDLHLRTHGPGDGSIVHATPRGRRLRGLECKGKNKGKGLGKGERYR